MDNHDEPNLTATANCDELIKLFDLLAQQGLSDFVFDNEAFQHINNVKENMAGRLDSQSLSAAEIMQSFNRAGNRDTIEQSANGVDQNQAGPFEHRAREVAAQRIGVYQALKEKIEQKTFFDYVFHPIKSYQESKALSSMKDSIKEDYNLSDDNLDKIGEIINDSKKLNSVGILHREDNSVVTNKPNINELEERKNLYWEQQKDAVMSQKDLDKSVSDLFEKSNDNDEIIKIQTEPTKVRVKENQISND